MPTWFWALPVLATPWMPAHWLELSPLFETLKDWLTSPLSARCSKSWLTAGATSLLLRSEEHTSELQSRQYLVCRLLLEKKNNVHLCLSFTHSMNLLSLNSTSLLHSLNYTTLLHLLPYTLYPLTSLLALNHFLCSRYLSS